MHYHDMVSCTAWRAKVPGHWTPLTPVDDVVGEEQWRSLATRQTVLNWLLKLKARYLLGDDAEAHAAAAKAKALLWPSATPLPLLDYVYYAALAVAALYENASADQQTSWRDLLSEHQEQLCKWADNDPATFGDKHALLSAEIARLDGRDRDAMRLYEQAIQAARAHGFVRDEGLANELAAGFYAACGVETIAHAYLRESRHCYLRCGALGKVRQLDERYPWLGNYPWLDKEQAASQPTTSLENAALHAALWRTEALLAEGQRVSRTGTWTWHVATGKLAWSEEHDRILGFAPKAVEPTWQAFLAKVYPEDRILVQRALDMAIRDGSGFAVDFRIALPDGSSRYLHSAARPLSAAAGVTEEFIGTTMDVTERKQGEEALRNAQVDLARLARLTMMGELATSIAHEINQPLSAIVMSANACVRWLANDRPNPDEARAAAGCIVSDAVRASEIIRSIRALASKTGPAMRTLDINEVVRQALVLIRGELYKRDVSIETDLSDNLPSVRGDRVQLQQVILNLMMNGVEAMGTVMHQPRVLRLRSEIGGPGTLRLAVEDSGPGLAPEIADSVFDAFFTTKPDGTGMGLSICRTIVNAHGGRLWASPRSPHGAIFQFTMPVAAGVAS